MYSIHFVDSKQKLSWSLTAALLKEVNEMGEQKCSEKDSKDLIQNKIKIIEIMSTVRRTSSV